MAISIKNENKSNDILNENKNDKYNSKCNIYNFNNPFISKIDNKKDIPTNKNSKNNFENNLNEHQKISVNNEKKI